MDEKQINFLDGGGVGYSYFPALTADVHGLYDNSFMITNVTGLLRFFRPQTHR